jgi:hypothetical protein
MPHTPMMVLESHPCAATLYATSDLTKVGVLQASVCMDALPDHVRVLRVDLRGVRNAEPNALRALEIALRVWRALRGGMSRVELPQDAGTTAVATESPIRAGGPRSGALASFAESLAFRFGMIARPS